MKNIKGTINDVIKKVSYRYMEANSPCEFYGAASVKNVFMQHTDGTVDINFDAIYPDAPLESYAYACTYILSKQDMEITVGVELSRGGSIWVNGECIAKTLVDDENLKKKKNVLIKVKKGKNPVFIKSQKTELGFGVSFGEGCIAWKPMYMYMPFREYEGYLGIAYTDTYAEDIFKSPESFPDIEDNMPAGFVKTAKEKSDVFDKDGYVYAASSLVCEALSEASLGISVSNDATVYVNSEAVGTGSGSFVVPTKLKKGRNAVVVEIKTKADSLFQFSCDAEAEGKKTEFSGDEYLLTDAKWLYLGVFDEKNPSAIRYENINTFIDTDKEFWRAGVSDCYIRKLRDNDIYGKWTYPIGVVLYGLLAAADCISDEKIRDYAIGHLKVIVDNQPYADFDGKLNGIPSINRQLTCLGMLDYCGSSGNALLEAMKYTDDAEHFEKIAKRVADYIENGQERLENGMFCREREDSVIDYKTIWADDLYMSVPFLCRYYKLTGDNRYLEDAVNQILCFGDKLYMRDKGCMSHVYNLIYGKRTCIPWGRGNGWSTVALTELLEVLPTEHNAYGEILGFYKDFCEGLLKLQDETGLWHQVLTHKDSYLETSCTAMFTYTFARGFLRGRLDERFRDAAIRGFDGIRKKAIDKDGNVYGVCCGSAYSFRADYYKYELPCVTNDTHGTGIVLLAAVEVSKLLK